jgi:hypothetical protein
MGNTSSLGIPMQRAHLHLEIGLLGNAHYDRWFRAQKLTPDHGVFNGQNFLGIDPLAFFRHQRAHPDCGFVDFLTTLPAAFEVVLNTNAPLDFFRRHPVLWRDGVYAGGPIVMGCAENGLPLWGRRASPADCAAMGSGVHGVVDVDETVVRGSGCRLLGRSGGRWGLTSKGVRWLEALTYPQKLERGKSGS